MKLSELKTGEKGVIIKVLGHGGFRRRIIEMGFIKGKTVEVVLNAPLKDPIKYKIMGYEVSLRRQEADMIEIVSEEEARRTAATDTYHEPISQGIPVSDEVMKNIAQGKRRTINVALVGNPNCGKTSLFNVASGGHEHVGNYSGVTVDAKEGFFDFQGYHFRLVDLPGTYSLSAYSPEELYVRKHIIEETPDVIINVVDAGNLERNLYLTTQLIDMNVRMVVALNMYDALQHSGNKLNFHKLSELLGVPMVPTVSRTAKALTTCSTSSSVCMREPTSWDRKKKSRTKFSATSANGTMPMCPDISMKGQAKKTTSPPKVLSATSTSTTDRKLNGASTT